jgi:hypothetical protein
MHFNTVLLSLAAITGVLVTAGPVPYRGVTRDLESGTNDGPMFSTALDERDLESGTNDDPMFSTALDERDLESGTNDDPMFSTALDERSV